MSLKNTNAHRKKKKNTDGESFFEILVCMFVLLVKEAVAIAIMVTVFVDRCLINRVLSSRKRLAFLEGPHLTFSTGYLVVFSDADRCEISRTEFLEKKTKTKTKTDVRE